MFVIGDYQEYFDAGHGHNEFKGENISSGGCLCWHPSSKSPTSILLVNIGWFGWFVWRWDYSNSYPHEGTYFKDFVKFAIKKFPKNVCIKGKDFIPECLVSGRAVWWSSSLFKFLSIQGKIYLKGDGCQKI